MDETETDIEACLCDEGEICRVCVDPALHQLIYLRLGEPWRSDSTGVRESASPLEWLAATASAN